MHAKSGLRAFFLLARLSSGLGDRCRYPAAQNVYQKPKLAALLVAVTIVGCGQPTQPAAMTNSIPFRMVVDDSFALESPEKIRVVVVGVIAEGEIRPGDKLTVQKDDSTISVTATALEAFHKPIDHAKAGDRVGIMLDGATKDQIGAGDVLTNPDYGA